MKATHSTDTTFTYSEAETIACLMEACCDMEQLHRDGKDHPNAKAGEKLLEHRGNHGSFTLRAALISLADDCEKAWQAHQALTDDHIAFDFEFCPIFLAGALESGLFDQAIQAQYGGGTPFEVTQAA